MKILGLCGGSGSGKGFVSKIFAKFDIPSIDADEVYHGIVSKKSDCVNELSSVFGKEILNPDGSLNRRELAKIVFSEKNSRVDKLNEITHKFILSEVEKIIESYRKSSKKAVLFDAPLLFEAGFDKKCDKIISVIADEELRIERIVKRDMITEQKARLRINSQKNDDFLISNSDFVIYNSGDYENAYRQTEKIIKEILKEI